MRETHLMRCGHVAQATDVRTGAPVCAICVGIVAGATEVVEKPSLEGRKAKCYSTCRVVDSKWELPFFEHCPEKEFDSYYCGCYGWE